MADISKLNHPVITGIGQNRPAQKPPAQPAQSFQELLRQRIGQETPVGTCEIVFSKHAQERRIERQIEISPEDMLQLDSAVELAQQKGLNDTLVYMRDKAFIVNVPNRVVITVVGGEDAGNTVFTNIDGAVIV